MAEARVELPGSHRPQATGAEQVGPADQGEEVEVTVTLRGPELPSADDVTGPPLTPDAYAAAYGTDPGDAAKVKEELQKFGLQVYDVSLAGRSMHARGTVAQRPAGLLPEIQPPGAIGHSGLRRIPAADPRSDRAPAPG